MSRDSRVKFGVVVFPGSNCDHDAYWALKHVVGQRTVWLWHKERDLQGCDVIVLPGGFSYGDYLREGAIARYAPIMESVREHARKGRPVLGICNGFQILVEAQILPGSLTPNQGLRFISRAVRVRTGRTDTCFTSAYGAGQVLTLPIAHSAGSYYADKQTIDQLLEDDLIAFVYCDRDGRVTEEANPNGSVRNIAGIFNGGRNVLGLMPHPERASEPLLGSEGGLGMLQSLAASA